jgi:hypothetical protein
MQQFTIWNVNDLKSTIDIFTLSQRSSLSRLAQEKTTIGKAPNNWYNLFKIQWQSKETCHGQLKYMSKHIKNVNPQQLKVVDDHWSLFECVKGYLACQHYCEYNIETILQVTKTS